MTAEVVSIYPTNFRDPSATLRVIADEIEAWKYGDVGCVAIALLGDTLEVFGAGEDSEGPQCALLFSAAALRFAAAIEEHGKQIKHI